MNGYRKCSIYKHIYTHNEILLSHKKKEILPNAKTDRPRRHYAKWNKSEKDKHHTISLTCGIQKHNKLTNIIKLKQMHKYREQTDDCQRGGIWGKEGEID